MQKKLFPHPASPSTPNMSLLRGLFPQLSHLPVPKTARCFTLRPQRRYASLAIITEGRARYVTVTRDEIHAEGFLTRRRHGSRKVVDLKFPRTKIGALQAAAAVLGVGISDTRAREIFASA